MTWFADPSATSRTGWLRGTVLCALTLLAVAPLAAIAKAETLLERGTYLMEGIVACGNCHTPQGPDGPLPGMKLAGGLPFEIEGFISGLSPNITPDVETGIGGWSDEEIIAAFREGRRPDGTMIGPIMPIALYRNISDRDARAIVAYLRAQEAVKNETPPVVYPFPLPPAYGPPLGSVPEVSRDDRLAYGAYLAGPLGHCIECHSPMGPNGPDWEHNLGAGGFEFPGPWGVSVSANITPTGLAGRSDAEIKTAITQGKRPDGSPMLPPMPFSYYANISAEDLDAIVGYLRSLPPK
jgi:mono/diheme cytochrome c family protein